MNPRDILSALLILLTPAAHSPTVLIGAMTAPMETVVSHSTLPKKPSFESAKSLQVSETSMSSFVVQPT